eukprot:jgi/Ulvmu1/2107/UM125_0011.1
MDSLSQPIFLLVRACTHCGEPSVRHSSGCHVCSVHMVHLDRSGPQQARPRAGSKRHNRNHNQPYNIAPGTSLANKGHRDVGAGCGRQYGAVAGMIGSRLLQQALADAPGNAGAVAPMSSQAPQPTPLQPPPPASLPQPAPPREDPAPILPANVTVVRTAGQLQRTMLRGAVDIEIREHLNLRNLTRPPNPAMPGQDTFQNRKHLALMYASSPQRSIRGNCSDPNPAAALSLRAGLTPALLPLRPRQCLLLLPDTWLMVNSGTLWIDNIYLRASRTRANPIFTFIQFGARDASQTDSQVGASANYITRLTVQPDGRGTTIGLTADINDISVVVDSYSLTYYAEDDEEYDVPLTAVPLGEASLWGEEFVIVNSTMSDCVYLLALDTTVYPGCPANSTDRRVAVRERAVGGADERVALSDGTPDAAVPFSEVAEYQDREELYPAGAGAGDYQYFYYLGPVGAYLYDYDSRNDPNVWFVEKFLDMDDPWIVATQQVLPPLQPAPGWPAFVLDPPPQPRNRTSLRPDVVDTGQLPLVPSSGTLVETSQQPQPLRQQIHGSFFVPFLATACVTALALAVIVVLARRDHMRSQALRISESSHRSKDKRVKRKISSDASGRAVSSNAPIPLTPMNPDYDYLLPPQLALFAQPPTAASADAEPGGTIVLPPYTVSTCSAADHLSKHVHPLASTTSHSSKPHTEPPYTAGLARCSWPLQHVMSVQLQAATTGSTGPRDGFDPSISIQRAATLPFQLKQRAQGTDSAGVCPEEQQRREQRLHQQLNLFQRDDLFLGRFEVLGRRQRRRGGQAVVQFLMDVSDRCEYAAKFFLDHDAFHTEAALYGACSPSVRSAAFAQQAARPTPPYIADGVTVAEISDVAGRFLPQVEAVCGEGVSGLVDPNGAPLPPCIVMEKGESLHDWSERAEPDLFASLAVLSNISSRLADMHEAGYVHRDLKPANVMWLPRQNRWTVIDFGCVARIGELAPLSFTLTYAAPEVAAAHQQQETLIESQTALDAWSLGVIAFELLTGAPAFNMLSEGITGVTARLLGELPLPWEGRLADELKRKLGSLQAPVQQLLQREPCSRMGMRQFGAACTDTFAQHTTGTTAEIER